LGSGPAVRRPALDPPLALPSHRAREVRPRPDSNHAETGELRWARVTGIGRRWLTAGLSCL
jgi:hypothetical protein